MTSASDKQGGCGQGAGPQAGRSAETSGPLTPDALDALARALADERKAFATYRAILDRFGEVRPFVNIVEAEQRHIGALLALYARYGAPVPPDETIVDPSILSLDIKALCEIGVDGEIENVRLYDEDLLPKVAAWPDVQAVLRRLRDASHDNHLPAFQRCAGRGEGGGGRGQGRGRRFRGGRNA